MRLLRNSFYFFLGVALMGWAMLSFAESCDGSTCTTPATPVTESPIQVWAGRTQHYTSSSSACQSFASALSYTFDHVQTLTGAWDGCYGYPNGNPSAVASVANLTVGWRCPSLPDSNVVWQRAPRNCTGEIYTCPTGYTLSGQTCSKPDTSNQCQYSANAQIGTKTYAFPRPQPSGVTWCVDHCSAYLVPDYYTSTVNYGKAFVNGAGGPASTCTSSGSDTPIPTEPEPDKNPPPCGPGQGVATMGNKVVCVDQGKVPSAETPVVKKETSTKTAPDGSQTINNTISTCTGAGACTTVTTTTITNATGGGAGTSGTPGTTTETTDSGTYGTGNGSNIGVTGGEGTETGDFCAKNPNLQICKGGMATENTLQKTYDEVKKLGNPTVDDDSALSGKGEFIKSDALIEQDSGVKALVSGLSVDASVAQSKSAWESAMSSGWFEPVDRGGCSPLSYTFSDGRNWTFDYCQTADRISSIAGYAMWFLLAVGLFTILTGGRG